MARKKKKTIIDPNSLKEYEVTASLKWHEDIELCLRVQAPNKEAAYSAFRERMAQLNKTATQRGDDVFEINIFRKPHTIVEVIDEDPFSLRSKKK